jgi:CheY-like chemotaxis protein
MSFVLNEPRVVVNTFPSFPPHQGGTVGPTGRPCRTTAGALVPRGAESPTESQAGPAATGSSTLEETQETPRFAMEDWCRGTDLTHRYRIVLADDHPVVRQTLKKLLNQQEDFHLVGESDNGLETLSLIKQFHPDLLVTDLMMPGMNGLEVTRRIRLSFPATRVVVVSVNADDPYVTGAFRCGASAFVLKPTCGRHLVPAVRAVLAGQRYVSPPLSGSLI